MISHQRLSARGPTRTRGCGGCFSPVSHKSVRLRHKRGILDSHWFPLADYKNILRSLCYHVRSQIPWGGFEEVLLIRSLAAAIISTFLLGIGLNAQSPAWTQMAPTGALPSVRGGYGAVRDSTTNQMIMFGGETTASGLTDLKDV